MKYIIKNCDNCYYYEDEGYWCEFERDNTHFANPCQNSDCLLKQIVCECKQAPGIDSELSQRILDLMKIEECE